VRLCSLHFDRCTTAQFNWAKSSTKIFTGPLLFLVKTHGKTPRGKPSNLLLFYIANLKMKNLPICLCKLLLQDTAWHANHENGSLKLSYIPFHISYMLLGLPPWPYSVLAETRDGNRVGAGSILPVAETPSSSPSP